MDRVQPKLGDLFFVEESSDRTLTAALEDSEGFVAENATILVAENGEIIDGRLRYRVFEKWGIDYSVEVSNDNPYKIRLQRNSFRRRIEDNSLTFYNIFKKFQIKNWKEKGAAFIQEEFGYSFTTAHRTVNFIKNEVEGSPDRKVPDYLIGNLYKPTLNFSSEESKHEFQSLMRAIKLYAKANDLPLGNALLEVCKNGSWSLPKDFKW